MCNICLLNPQTLILQGLQMLYRKGLQTPPLLREAGGYKQ